MKQASFPKKTIWITLVLLLSLTSCSLPGANSEPTAIVYPTAAVAPTSPPPPTAVPTPDTPNTEIVNVSSEAVAGNPVVISYAVESFTGLSAVELTLNSVDGESIAFDRADDLKTEIGKIEYEALWTPDKAGEYTLFLTAYDVEKRASEPATVKITVSSRVSVEIVDVSKDAVVGNPVAIEYSVESNTGTGLSAVELTLNSVDGEVIAFDRADDLKTATDKIGYSAEWTPDKSGEYTLYLTAYDLESRASDPATMKIMVLPRISVEIVDVSKNAVAGSPVTISYSVDSNTDTGLSSVELTLNSVGGEMIAFDRAGDLRTETGQIGYSAEWTPTKAGEYTLFLTAYDLNGNPSGTATVKITVAPSP